MTRKFIFACIKVLILLLIGYFAGNLIPTSYLSPAIKKNSLEIEAYQYYDFYIKIIAASATFMAVLVALFREEIRKIFFYHKLSVKPHIPQFLTEVISESSTFGSEDSGNSDDSVRKAEKYELILYAANAGRIPAKECFVCIEKVVYKKTESDEEKILDIYNIPLKWVGIQDSRTTISISAKASFSALSITNENKHKKEDKEKKNSALLYVGDQDVSKKFKSGVWLVTYAIYTADARPHRYCLQITWDGKWKPRLTDLLEECISFKEVTL